MATTNVIMPQMGESITEATITKWRKQVGEDVREGEVLLDISTAKVEVEIPAPAAGSLLEVKFPEGATVPIDTLIAVLGPKGAVPAAAVAAVSAPPAKSAAAGGSPQAPQKSAPAQPAAPAPSAKSIATNGAGAHKGDVESQRAELLRQRSTPLVRNMAKEFGVDLATVEGTGAHGRVTRKDLEAFMKAPKPAVGGSQAPIRTGGEVVPLSMLRRQIAEHMVRSRRVSPHAYTVFDVDFTRMERLRSAHKAEFEKRHGAKLTPLVFLLRIIATLLPKYPMLNSSMHGEDAVVRHRSINLGVAVAIPNGLIVPVIHDAGSLSLPGIARALGDKAARARSGKLMPADIEGGTFTVTSPGQLGAVMGTPIINQPQAAILGTGALVKRPMVVPDPKLGEVIAVRDMMYLSLSYDHRLVDGADAARFLSSVKARLEAGDFAGELGL